MPLANNSAYDTTVSTFSKPAMVLDNVFLMLMGPASTMQSRQEAASRLLRQPWLLPSGSGNGKTRQHA